MRRIAHIINPVIVPETSDLYYAQPVTFETMRIAKEFAREKVEVEFYSAQYPEDRPLIPSGFTSTPDLDRSVLDVGNFEVEKKLPLIDDILDRLYQATTAEYLIYTNVDIALMPAFYLAVNQHIDKGYDAIVINRRKITDRYSKVSEIPLMYSEVGELHPGHDCFVFRRDAYPAYILGNTCIGAAPIGRVLICNLACHADRYQEFKDYHLTFHLGESPIRKPGDYSPYNDHNFQQADVCLDKLEATYGPFSADEAVYQYILHYRKHAKPPKHVLDRAYRIARHQTHRLLTPRKRTRASH